jgi:uncharacterized protein (TIGR02145 family)
MKRILTLLLVLIGLNGTAQVVDGINYQAVALDEDGREIPGTDINGNVLAESMFDVRFTIRSATNDGTIEYQETHADVNTDNFGLFTVVIGHGSTTTSSPVAMLNDIDWGADKHFLEVEVDLEQDGNYKLMSNQQMMAVPYAFYALNVGDVEWGNISDVPADLLDGDNVDDADNDPTNELQDWTTLPGIPADILDGDDVDDADNDPTNELQDWTTLPGIPADILDGDDVDDADNDPTNELQIISISNDTIYLTNGGFAVIPQSASVDWTNITNIPADILDGDNVDDADNDPTNELQDWSTLPGIPADILDGDNVDDADNDPTNELQTWSTLPGIPVDLADGIDNVDDADNDPTNEITTVTDNGDGTSTLTDALGGTVTVDNDGIDNVDDADNDPLNEIQVFTLSNDTLYISGGNSIYVGGVSNGDCSTTDQVLKTDGTTAVCSNITDNGTSVGINNTTPDANAVLDVSSTSQGFLPPRLTTAQRDNIVSPQPGLTIYNTDENCMEWWNGTSWYNACTGNIAGSIATLDCGSAVNTGTLTEGQAASGVSSSVPYTGGNGGTHSGQIVSSTGVTGLTATLAAGTFAVGSGNLTYTISGTPASAGTASFTLSIGGQSCTLSLTVDVFDPASLYAPGSVFCASGPTVVVEVTNPSTGAVWMDRNLGASQAATSSTDANSYGDLYQWGRGKDGHQCRTSGTTATQSSTDQPGHDLFIIDGSAAPYDWRNPQNDNLWQGVNGINNPCPTGFRIPTSIEFSQELTTWSSLDATGAVLSNLKLPLAGYRVPNSGNIFATGSSAWYWSTSINSIYVNVLYFSIANANINTGFDRGYGVPVRCIKD